MVDINTTLDKLVAVFVGAILAAVLIPIAILQLSNPNFINFSGESINVDPASIALYAVLSIAVIVVVVVMFFKLI